MCGHYEEQSYKNDYMVWNSNKNSCYKWIRVLEISIICHEVTLKSIFHYIILRQLHKDLTLNWRLIWNEKSSAKHISLNILQKTFQQNFRCYMLLFSDTFAAFSINLNFIISFLHFLCHQSRDNRLTTMILNKSS